MRLERRRVSAAVSCCRCVKSIAVAFAAVSQFVARGLCERRLMRGCARMSVLEHTACGPRHEACDAGAGATHHLRRTIRAATCAIVARGVSGITYHVLRIANLGRPTTNNQRPTTNEQRTTNNEQRTTNNEQRTARRIAYRPSAARGSRAFRL
ncbi:hypothetical protein BP1026A_1937 [Burkholderia pseudomallei 1026a]|nr:hypothetical protein BP1026A_1937 [Burkholderia pseudomallei 1026a]